MIFLCLGVDVEESGLFSGKYSREATDVQSVVELPRLADLCAEFNLPLTLFVDYPVLHNDKAVKILQDLEKNYHAEIGAHLHPWNTPPFADLPYQEPIPCRLIPLELLEEKLYTVLGLIKDRFASPASSFRMGRFDFTIELGAMLAKAGLKTDSSLVPLRTVAKDVHNLPGPNHFLVPSHPFMLNFPKPKADNGTIAYDYLLEVPLTQVSLWPATVHPTAKIAGYLGKGLLTFYRQFMVLGIHPAWFPFFSMCLAARLHCSRGEQVLNMFLHSTEIQPGGHPKIKTRKDADAILKKVHSFLKYIRPRIGFTGITLGKLADNTELKLEQQSLVWDNWPPAKKKGKR